MGRKRKPGSMPLPLRWKFQHGAFYYRTREDERDLFDGKTWFRLAANYPDALRAFADRRELEMGDTLASVIDRYIIEELPRLRPQTRQSYLPSLARLRATLGHNPFRLITPRIVYQHMDAVAKAHTMNVANMDLKVIGTLAACAVRWGVIAANPIKGNVKGYGVRQGLKVVGGRYVEDWELAEWRKVARPFQLAFAAIVLLIGTRKCDTLRLQRSDARDGELLARATKTSSEQTFEITPALQDAIDFAIGSQGVSSFYLIPNSQGRCFVDSKTDRCNSFDEAWRDTMKLALVETDLKRPFTPKDLRTKAGSDEERLERAQEILGHTSPAMTKKHYRRKRVVIRPAK